MAKVPCDKMERPKSIYHGHYPYSLKNISFCSYILYSYIQLLAWRVNIFFSWNCFRRKIWLLHRFISLYLCRAFGVTCGHYTAIVKTNKSNTQKVSKNIMISHFLVLCIPTSIVPIILLLLFIDPSGLVNWWSRTTKSV